MLIKSNKNRSKTNILVRFALFVSVILCLAVISGFAQNAVTKKISAKADLPVWQGYKGVTIGMTADEVRAKLGAPKSEDAAELFYLFSENETAQILLDTGKRVRAISVMFGADYLNAPKFENVFGKPVNTELKPDGSIFKMERYPDARYWVSYSRMAGDKAMVVVMIQKF